LVFHEFGQSNAVSSFAVLEHFLPKYDSLAKSGADVFNFDGVAKCGNTVLKLTMVVRLPAASLHTHPCPHVGRYTVAGQLGKRRRRSKSGPSQDLSQDGATCSHNDFETLFVGCSHNNHEMEFHSTCGKEPVKYSCHGHWEENGTSYLIASPLSRGSGEPRRYCFVYSREAPSQALPLAGTRSRDWAGNPKLTGPVTAASKSPILRLSSIAETCHRDLNLGVDGFLALNLTHDGEYTAFFHHVCTHHSVRLRIHMMYRQWQRY